MADAMKLSAGERAFTAWAASSRADATPLMWIWQEMPQSQRDRWEAIAQAALPLAAAPPAVEGGVPYTLTDLCQEVRRRDPAAFDGTDPIAEHPPSLQNATDRFIAVCLAALATREEAPAEGAGEAWFTTDVVEVEYRDGNGETHMFPNEVEWAEVVRWRPQPAAALRGRTSEPAREAVAWRYRYPNDTAWQLTQDHDQAFKNTGEVEPLGVIPFPAPATADKLKVAKEALERMVALYESEQEPENLRRPDWLDQALAALNEEG